MAFARTFNLGLGRQLLMTKETNKLNVEEPWQVVMRLRSEDEGLDGHKISVGYQTEQMRDYVFDHMTEKDAQELVNGTKSLVKKFRKR